MDYLIIFSAKYLWIASLVLAVFAWMRVANKKSFISLSILLPTSYLLGVIARKMYFNPRPFVENNFAPLIEHAPDNGFPSDHVLLVASLATLITLFDRKLGALAWIIVILVAASRVLAGVHHVLDVSASVLISIAVGAVVYFSHKFKQNAANNTPNNASNNEQ